jgi:hypothetical protein
MQRLVCDGCQSYRKAKYGSASAFLASVDFNHAFFLQTALLQTINKRLGLFRSLRERLDEY